MAFLSGLGSGLFSRSLATQAAQTQKQIQLIEAQTKAAALAKKIARATQTQKQIQLIEDQTKAAALAKKIARAAQTQKQIQLIEDQTKAAALAKKIARAATLHGFGISPVGLAGFDEQPPGTMVTTPSTVTTNWWGNLGSALSRVWESGIAPIAGQWLETERLKQQAKVQEAEAEIARQATALEQVRAKAPIVTVLAISAIVGGLGYWYLKGRKRHKA